MLLSFVVLALLASVQGRAVNISNTWVLPEEGFPVFYRYFRDRISWYEADAVCQFHHANLVTVDTTAQYDAVRAYLKELDISSAVWVGLIRSNPDGDFTWTDYRGLSSDGYWSSAPDARSAPLCAAADPAADYRWEARACGGPTVASFICELPVPQWALGNEGCMVRALPALTILYLPESAAVQLTADCGMAGVKKVQCTGNVKREDLLRELSCTDEEDLSSSLSPISTGLNWPASTDSTFTDQDTTNEITTDEPLTTEHEVDINQPRILTVTSLPQLIYPQTQYKTATKINTLNNIKSVLLSKNINLGENLDNNIQSNFIPKIASEDNILTNDQLEKLEDERHMKHKMLHEEIARVGNVENIFSQPTDHFIPPLVMAKAKISDDMTVLSLAEKHAQQLAEKQFTKYHLNDYENDRVYSEKYSAKSPKDHFDKTLITSVKPKFKDNKKDTTKYNLPKKYVSEKYYDVKNKVSKNTEIKLSEIEQPTEHTTTETIQTVFTTKKTDFGNTDITDDDSGMELKVLLKEPSATEENISFAGDVAKLEIIKKNYIVNDTDSKQNISVPLDRQVEFITTMEPNIVFTSPKPKPEQNITLTHNVIKITIVADDDDSTIHNTTFEISTKMPVFHDHDVTNSFTTVTSETTNIDKQVNTQRSTTLNQEIIESTTAKTIEPVSSTTLFTFYSTVDTSVTNNVTTMQPLSTPSEITTNTEFITTVETQQKSHTPQQVREIKNVSSTASLPTGLDKNVTTTTSNETMENIDEFNGAEYHELMNMTDHPHAEEDLNDTDFQSPLLSGAMEPMHRPARTRRPQQPIRNKFNPFRILG